MLSPSYLDVSRLVDMGAEVEGDQVSEGNKRQDHLRGMEVWQEAWQSMWIASSSPCGDEKRTDWGQQTSLRAHSQFVLPRPHIGCPSAEMERAHLSG